MAEDGDRPTLFMIAGPNGAGKSTLYETRIKPRINAPFLNADVVQKTELDDQTPQGSYAAAEIVRERRRKLMAERKSFVTESVFSHKSRNQLLEDAKDAGYRIVLYHVDIRSEDLSVARVKSRVAQGGHDVPEDKARARYHRNKPLIRKAAREADLAFIYDNSVRGRRPELIVKFREGQAVQVSKSVPKWARDLYERDLRAFTPARLNPAAASYEQVSGIAREKLGTEANVLIPRGRKAFVGKILGESSQHVLQQTDDGRLYAHFKTLMTKVPSLGNDVKIDYPHSRKAVVQRAEILMNTMSIDDAKAELTASSGYARKAFENEAALATKANDRLSQRRSQALVRTLGVAGKMLDTMKLAGITSLPVQTRSAADRADVVRQILTVASKVYGEAGLGKKQQKVRERDHDRSR